MIAETKYSPSKYTAMKKILIVEDSPVWAKNIEIFIRQALEELNPKIEFEIDVVEKEQEAIDLIENHNYCLITQDGRLKEGYGVNVIKRINQAHWQKFIAISSEESFLNDCKKKGIPAFDKQYITENEKRFINSIKKIVKVN